MLTCDECGGSRKDKRSKHCRRCSVLVRWRKRGYREKVSAAIRRACPVTKPIYRNPRGYIYEHAPDHPKASGGKVAQHVLVMERLIGRYLRHGEEVHHKNHDRSDNRIENLELVDGSEHASEHALDLWKKVKALGFRSLKEYGLARRS